MDKPFLLIAGEHCYPQLGTGDWIDRFETQEEARIRVVKTKEVEEAVYALDGICFETEEVIAIMGDYVINGQKYDWYMIVNLETWVPSRRYRT